MQKKNIIYVCKEVQPVNVICDSTIMLLAKPTKGIDKNTKQ